MPVILDNGSDQIRNWLDPNQSEWSSELQSLLKPYRGELECYPVSKEVGKVGNNSPAFIVPVASSENKSNIANFFSNATKTSKRDETLHESTEEGAQTDLASGKKAITSGQNSTGDNVPPSVPASTSGDMSELKRKREVNRSPHGDDPNRTDASMAKAQAHAPRTASPQKTPAKKLRSATSNGTRGSPTKTGDGSQRITQFFNK